MKLGLQFSAVSDTLQTYAGLNDEQIQARDLREVLSKFVYNESRRCFLYILSFSSVGTTIDVVCTRATGSHGDYDAATLFIPSGVKVEGGKLCTMITDFKEDLILSPQRRRDPSKASYARYIEEEHSDDEFPVLPEPKSDETAFIVYGNGASHPSLVRLLINLYRPAYSHFRHVVLLDNLDSVAPASGRGGLENALHSGFDPVRREPDSLTDLSNSPLPAPNILYKVEVSGGEQPAGLLVDKVYVKRLPIFVGPKFSLGFDHEQYFFTPQIIQTPPDGVVRIRDINWDMRLLRSDFVVVDTVGDPVDEANVYINGRFLSKQIILPVSEASTAEVAVEARAYHSFRSRMDLTRNATYKITLSGSRLARKYVVDGTSVSFLLEQKDSDTSRNKPIKGYSVVGAGRDGEYHLAYEKYSFLRNPLFITLVSIALLLGLGIGYLLGCDSFEKKNEVKKPDSRPGVELFSSSKNAPGDSTREGDSEIKANDIPSVPLDTVPAEAESETSEVLQPVETSVPDNVGEQIQPEAPSADPTLEAALEYVNGTKVWNRDVMESYDCTKGLWDAINHYNASKIASINETLGSDRLTEIVGLLNKKGKTGSYVLDPEPGDKNADKDITVSVYLAKIQ